MKPRSVRQQPFISSIAMATRSNLDVKHRPACRVFIANQDSTSQKHLCALQSDPELLGKNYVKMAFKFESEGLNLSAVEDSG